MSIFSKQGVYCQSCGNHFTTNFQRFGGEVCSRRCWQELQWRKTLSIMGKEYYTDPTPHKCICGELAKENNDYCKKCEK